METNECVILPGLGGFVTTHKAAYYDEEKGIFMPPARVIAFQERLTLDDGLLEQSYMETEGLTYPEAVSFVARLVDNVRQALSKDGYCDLEQIGRLSQNIAGTYYFTPSSSNGSDAPEFYGLMPVHMPALPVRQVAMPQTVDIPVERKQPADAYPFYSKKGISIHLSTSTLNKVAGFVIMFLLVFLFATPFGTIQPGDFQSGFALSMLKDTAPVMKKAPRKVTPQVVPQTKNSDDTNITNRKAEQTTSSTSSYCIVLASGVTQANADAFIRSLASKGIQASLLEKGKMRRVVYSSFNNKEEAQVKLNSLRQTNDLFSTAWVLEQ